MLNPMLDLAELEYRGLCLLLRKGVPITLVMLCHVIFSYAPPLYGYTLLRLFQSYKKYL